MPPSLVADGRIEGIGLALRQRPAAAVQAMIPLTRSVLWGPMAIPLMGALVATTLTLVFVPALSAARFRIRRDSPAHMPAAEPPPPATAPRSSAPSLR